MPADTQKPTDGYAGYTDREFSQRLAELARDAEVWRTLGDGRLDSHDWAYLCGELALLAGHATAMVARSAS